MSPITVRLPLKTESLNFLLKMHFRSRAKMTKMHRAYAKHALRAKAFPSSITLPVVVTMTRHSAGTLDDDNLHGALKAVRDGVSDWLHLDDADPRVTFVYEQARCEEKKYWVMVEVRSA